jgi:elongation factor 1-alpha
MEDRTHQKLAMIGHVGHGKSTLAGRLLFETESVPGHVIEREKADTNGSGFASVMDYLVRERERGLTTDIVHQKFATDGHSYTIVDAPGHRDFVKDMITGASQADHVVLVVAADDGVQPQTREHVFLAQTLGIGELVIAINKIDLVSYDENRFREITGEVKQLFEQVQFDIDTIRSIPVSAFDGDNVEELSDNTPWYDGETLLEALNGLPEVEPPTDAPLRVPIQDVYTISDIGTVPVGRVETGILETGADVSFQPSDASGEVESIEVRHQEVSRTEPDGNVGFNVSGIGSDDICRGDVCGPAEDPPTVVETFQAEVVVMQHPIVITAGYTPVIHAHTAQVACKFHSIDTRYDPDSGDIAEDDPVYLKNGDEAVVTLRPQQPLSIEPSSAIPELGSFAIRDMGQIIAAGKVMNTTEK